MATWWAFYCGIVLTPVLVLPGLLRKGKVRWIQGALLILLVLLWLVSDPRSSIGLWCIFDLAAFAQIALLWFVFDGFWPRLASLTCALLIFESFFVKLFFPHYFAPAACLVLFLQVEGLRRIWQWKPQTEPPNRALTRAERRRLARENSSLPTSVAPARTIVYLVPIACVLSLVLRVEARVHGWKTDPHGPDREALLTDDWSLRRAELEHWLEGQPTPQLVFVWYSARHHVTEEWVYNHADLMHSHVIWAHNWGVEHNRLLLQQLPGRTVWLLDADRREPQLIPYSEVEKYAPQIPVQTVEKGAPQDQPEQ